MSDRKYRHRGYQDDDRERPAAAPRGPREHPPGPRGRGLGKPTATVFRCAVCCEKQRSDTDVSFEAACWKCGADLHTCTHCRHFDSSAVNQCREPVEERVAMKAKRNACGHFRSKAAMEFAADAGSDSPSAARTAFDALFKL